MSTAKKAVAKPQSCKSNGHNFVSIETTPSFIPYGGGQLGSLGHFQTGPARVFKIFCTKCAEVRGL